MKQIILFLSFCFLLLISSCGSDDEVVVNQLEVDLATIEDYLKENNLTAQSTTSGLHYIIGNQGPGDKVNVGTRVVVHYTGKFLNGTVFDTSLDPGRSAIEFTVGSGQLIRGFDEAATLLNGGGYGTFILPSHLAYGTSGVGSIPPNTVLIFEINIIEIK